MANVCSSCGNALPAGVQFCTNCGAKFGAVQPAPPVQKQSSGCGKILLNIFIILLLLTVGFGVLGYWGYKKVAQKVQQKWEQTKSEIEKSEMGQSEKNQKTSHANEITEEPCPASDLSTLSLDQGTIPMKVGLTMAKTWTTNKGDYETLTQVQSVDNNAVTVTTSGPDTSSSDPTAKTHGRRNICIDDLRDGTSYLTGWGANAAETVRSATMFSLSRKEFEELKSKSQTSFTYFVNTARAGDDSYLISAKNEGTVTRVESEDVPVGVIVNDQKVELPTIHAKGNLSGHTTEFYAIDDVNNPIVLDFHQPDIRFQIKILKISYPEEKKIEKQLEETGKVLVYGIYFDFNSANIREESEPVLKEIADALNAHPEWKLSVNGHTDNVGGATYNIGLSNRRSAAVKQALVDRYNIAADRLTTAGFGMSQPIETNDTAEGRARNRRVELIKQ